MIYSESFMTPIGALTVTADEEALLRVEFREDANTNGNSITELAKSEINGYFGGSLKNFTVPYRLEGTPFQIRVWNALAEIPYGETASYKDIAEIIGNPKACRAVGMANNRNRLPIIIPCHRVIGSSGKPVGYAGGIDIKEKLLNIENKNRLDKRAALICSS